MNQVIKLFLQEKWHLGEDEEFWPEFQGFDINIGGWTAGAPRITPNVSNGYYSPYGNPRLKDGPKGEYLTDRLTDESIQFISNNRETPFFYISPTIPCTLQFKLQKNMLINSKRNVMK